MVDFLQLLIPLVIRDAIDLLASDTVPAHAILRPCGAIVAIALVIVFFRYVWRLLIFGHARKVEEGLRNRLYSHLQTLSPSFYQNTNTGDIMARATHDINAVRMAAGMGLVALTDGLVLGMAAVGFMVSINLRLTLISLIPAPLVVVLSRILTRRMSVGFQSVQKSFSDLTERIREAFSGIRVIKAYNREMWQYEGVKDSSEQYLAVNMKQAKSLALFFPVMAVFTNVGLAVVIWMGGRLTILGSITMGDFVAFTGYLNLLTWPMMAMGWVTSLIQRAWASMGRINSILEQVPEITDMESPRTAPRIRGGIEFRDLSIRYPGQKRPALKDVRLEIKAGETVAIAGGVGAGKTTLLQAVPRLLDVPYGTLYVDGRDVRTIPLKVLRGNIGFVTQEPFIFSDTIRNNVLFGLQDVSSDKLETVLTTADIMEEILALDNGLDTLLGERGITLSGGQRQRLTIARALLPDPPVLILDDALSMVDIHTEKNIWDRIISERRDRTNLIVSHRVSTLSRANRIVVLEQGCLVEQGTHDTLVAMGGVYARLYRRQELVRKLETGDA
ncbi:MAG: ABC transporter ATP-binding protein [Deltaproteobacteria bacterium]|nr:MAG: ABC transporter ATP-binding protein [Deltaproteobacteria bacterium]